MSMNTNDLNEVTSTEDLTKLTEEELKDYAMNYLIRSGFVDALVKKNVYPDDIDNYYDDFRQEAYLAILELKMEVWDKLLKSAIEKDVEYEYEIRNYVSRVILNTVKSTSSNAYRKLKKPSVKEKIIEDAKWSQLRSDLTEPKSVEELIMEFNNK